MYMIHDYNLVRLHLPKHGDCLSQFLVGGGEFLHVAFKESFSAFSQETSRKGIQKMLIICLISLGISESISDLGGKRPRMDQER